MAKIKAEVNPGKQKPKTRGAGGTKSSAAGDAAELEELAARIRSLPVKKRLDLSAAIARPAGQSKAVRLAPSVDSAGTSTSASSEGSSGSYSGDSSGEFASSSSEEPAPKVAVTTKRGRR